VNLLRSCSEEMCSLLPAVISTMNVEVVLKLLVDMLESEVDDDDSHPPGGHTSGGFKRGMSGGGTDLLMICTASTMLGRSDGFELLHAMPSWSSRMASSASNSAVVVSTASTAASRLPSA
jgi:hypothetical protein